MTSEEKGMAVTLAPLFVIPTYLGYWKETTIFVAFFLMGTILDRLIKGMRS